MNLTERWKYFRSRFHHAGPVLPSFTCNDLLHGKYGGGGGPRRVCRGVASKNCLNLGRHGQIDAKLRR